MSNASSGKSDGSSSGDADEAASLFFGTFRRKLVTGVAGIHGLLLSVFLWDLTLRQQSLFLHQQVADTLILCRTLATSAGSWMVSRDISGLIELVKAQGRNKEVDFAMLLDEKGKVLAHTDSHRLGLYVKDLPSEVSETILTRDSELIDVLTPVVIAGIHVGWARIGMSQAPYVAKQRELVWKAILYGICAISVGALVIWFMARAMTRRLHNIQEIMDQIQGGDWRPRAPVAGEEEAVSLARGLNMMLDVLERQERELRESESRFQHLFEKNPVSVWEVDFSRLYAFLQDLRGKGVTDIEAYLEEQPDAVKTCAALVTVRDVNKAALLLCGAGSKEELISHLPNVSTAQAARTFIEEIVTVWKGEKSLHQEASFRNLAREMKDVAVHWAAEAGDESYAKVIVSRVDITSRKEAERALQLMNDRLEEMVATRTRMLNRTFLDLAASEKNLRIAQRVAHIGSWNFDIITKKLQWSEETCRIFGVPFTEPVSLGLFIKTIHPDDRARVMGAWSKALQGQSYGVEHRIQVDGEVRWVREEAEITFAEDDGSPVHAVGTAQDITVRRLAEEQLREAYDFNERIIRDSPTGIAVYRADGQCIIANRAMSVILGATEEQLLAQNFRTIQSWRESPLLEYALQALDTGEVQKCDVDVTTTFGRRVSLDCEFACISSGGRPNLLVIINDITQFRETEMAQRQAREAAEKSNRSKSEFLANMSHEIRTPMNAIIGLSRLALESGLNPRQQDYIQKIHTSSKALLTILNDILDYSKIEAGRLHLERISFSLDEVLETLTDLFAISAENKGLKISFEACPDVPRMLRGDPLRLGQILNNLTGNAVKFTERGEVRVRVECLKHHELSVDLRFSVRDTGIGIPERIRSELFQAFRQADGSISRRYGGTGLGLVISRHLVELMGGEISVESEPGRGSTFSFQASFELATAEKTSELRPESETKKEAGTKKGMEEELALIRGARLLLVEDNPINQQVAAEFLRLHGFLVDIAENGRQGLEQVQKQHYDVVLMDLQMPEMDGLEATRRIREQETEGHLPIIALTAAAMSHEKQACLDCGMDDHVAKPLDVDQLFRVLLKWIKPNNRKEVAPAAPQMEARTAEREITLPDRLEGFDLEATLNRIHQNRALLAELLVTFAGDIDRFLKELRQLLDSNDLDQASRLTHTVKGLAANLGGVELMAAAQALEQELKEGKTDSVAAFEEKMQKTREVILSSVSVGKTVGRDGEISYDHDELELCLRVLRAKVEAFDLVSEEELGELSELLAGVDEEEGEELLLQLRTLEHEKALATLDRLAQILALDVGAENGV